MCDEETAGFGLRGERGLLGTWDGWIVCIGMDGRTDGWRTRDLDTFFHLLAEALLGAASMLVERERDATEFRTNV
jgi:hypothetical protein